MELAQRVGKRVFAAELPRGDGVLVSIVEGICEIRTVAGGIVRVPAEMVAPTWTALTEKWRRTKCQK